MGTRDEEFLAKLYAAFKVEADEHLSAISKGLLELEKDPHATEATEIIEIIFREAHSLKGAARSVDKDGIESVCQAVESVFAALKAGRMESSPELFDALHEAADAIGDLVSESEEVEIHPIVRRLVELTKRPSDTGPMPSADAQPAPIRQEPEKQQNKDVSVDGTNNESAGDNPAEMTGTVGVQETGKQERENARSQMGRISQSETVRIAVDKLDPLLRQVGEMVAVKLTANQRVSDLQDVLGSIDKWKKQWTSVSSNEKLIGKMLMHRHKSDVPGNNGKQDAELAEFLEWNENLIKSLESSIRELARSADSDARMHGGMVDDLLEDMMNVLMLPCSWLLDMFPKLLRDLSRDRGKDASLTVTGGDLEIDRRILEEMKDPLIHLVRNCIDHGIENPEERSRAGKPTQGTITIAISQVSGNQIEMVVSDDGAGINLESVQEAARGRGILLGGEQSVPESQDPLSLVFRSGVSTKSTVSTISGRGLGLAIVREKVENLGGNITVETESNVGTSFRMLLPVTLSTFRGILVRAGDHRFVIPTANVERVARIKKDLIKTVGNKETIEVDDRAVQLARLDRVLELPPTDNKNENSSYVPVLILRSAEARVSFAVDDVIREQEVLVKPLGKQLTRVRNIAGATVLGSGKLAPILNVPDLISTAIKSVVRRPGTDVRSEESENGSRHVLVAEDSITSRMLLKNILESSGYEVTTSVDGADAWAALKTNEFDLVVSDIQMPRMDGFELTSKIRNDENLSELPVVLVTSLASREDRERGIDAGANAYITKGGFDQNNLLEAVSRLI